MAYWKELCIKYDLGNLIGDPRKVTGGLMHTMYHVVTDQGEYAIKVLNPDIMKRPEALRNMINSEMVSHAFIGTVPLVAAKSFNEKYIIEESGSYYMLFDWLEGRSVFAPEISVWHCKKMGEILGKIHSAKIMVETIAKNEEVRGAFDWERLMEKAGEEDSMMASLLQETVEDIVSWDEKAVSGLGEACKEQVISHRDLDPKNVMWKDDQPYVIDWEAAGYVNPYQELIEVLNYWIQDRDGRYDKEKFKALMGAYVMHMDVSHVNWDSILYCSLDGMLGWLEYNLKRALKLEGTDAKDVEKGVQQSISTIKELKQYGEQVDLLKNWLEEAAGSDH